MAEAVLPSGSAPADTRILAGDTAVTPRRLKGRKRVAKVAEWKQIKRKTLRNSGREYTMKKNKVVNSS